MDAIQLNDNLVGARKWVLITIASQMDVRGDYTEERWIPIAQIARRAGISRHTVHRCLNELESQGYITRRHRNNDGGKCASWFSITWKVFDEFENTGVRVMKPLRSMSHAAI